MASRALGAGLSLAHHQIHRQVCRRCGPEGSRAPTCSRSPSSSAPSLPPPNLDERFPAGGRWRLTKRYWITGRERGCFRVLPDVRRSS
ncbi:hypothetical protein BRADI_4g22707v3 [Brachypodium distachyon]|uniref:Uncharacterized protein n=1 Tax=Brachypodium distachyon TaxID=15368 RepID=A0A2K2CPJ6_BRADI|nr:hypothetical protein BRADI_4g22707v3 [Brachypodium distachyon]